MLSPQTGPPGVVVLVVVVTGVVVVVDPPPGQPFAQASQQLPVPMHAVPPFGALHFDASLLIWHFCLPFLSIRQQVTASGRPQVDFAAHCVISPRHCSRRSPFFTASFTTSFTQCTWSPWLAADAQSHSAAARARTSASCVASSGSEPHALFPLLPLLPLSPLLPLLSAPAEH